MLLQGYVLMNTTPIHFLGVDCSTAGMTLLVKFLERRKGVVAVKAMGPYSQDESVAKVFVDAEFDENELDRLLYNVWNPPKSDAEVYGTFTRRNYLKKDGYLFDKIEAVPIKEIIWTQT